MRCGFSSCACQLFAEWWVPERHGRERTPPWSVPRSNAGCWTRTWLTALRGAACAVLLRNCDGANSEGVRAASEACAAAARRVTHPDLKSDPSCALSTVRQPHPARDASMKTVPTFTKLRVAPPQTQTSWVHGVPGYRETRCNTTHHRHPVQCSPVVVDRVS